MSRLKQKCFANAYVSSSVFPCSEGTNGVEGPYELGIDDIRAINSDDATKASSKSINSGADI